MTIQVTKTFTTQTTRMLVGERGQAVIMVATEEDLLFLSSTGRDPCWWPTGGGFSRHWEDILVMDSEVCIYHAVFLISAQACSDSKD